MSLNKLIFVVLLIGIFMMSCEQNSKNLKIVFPDNIEKTENYIVSHKYVIVIQINDNDCVPCSFNDLKQWKLHENILDKYDIGVLLVLPIADEQKASELLKSLDMQFHIVFDKIKKFRVINDRVLRAARDGVFVIDKDKNVIFAGSPIATEEKWNAFINLVIKNG
jgi:hypothetical protein